jgi:hypothetical protein
MSVGNGAGTERPERSVEVGIGRIRNRGAPKVAGCGVHDRDSVDPEFCREIAQPCQALLADLLERVRGVRIE